MESQDSFLLPDPIAKRHKIYNPNCIQLPESSAITKSALDILTPTGVAGVGHMLECSRCGMVKQNSGK